MYRKTSKIRKRAELSLIYTLMALAVVGLVAILILVMQGYRFNKYDGKIEQGGLLQYDSQPDGGVVTIDDLALGNQTPNKITVSAGAHTVKMSKSGYMEWKKDVTITPGGVLWLNYTRFVPEKRPVAPLLQLEAVTDTAVSRDKKNMAIKEVAASPEVTLVNVDSENPTRSVVQFAAGSYTAPEDPATVSFALEGWDRDNRYVLIRHLFDGKTEWLVLDTRDEKIVNNVSSTTGLDIKTAQFTYANNRALYVLTATGEVRRVDLGASTASDPLVTNVQEFSQFDRSTIVFTTLVDPATKIRSVGYLTNGARASRTLRSYADDGQSALHIAIGHYYNQNYAAISYGETVDIMRGDLPGSDNTDASMMKRVATMSVPGGVDYLGFSPEQNRHVFAQNTQRVMTYDLELEKAATTTLTHAPTDRLAWIDRYHFVNAAGGRVMLYEFDGQNAVEMATDALPYAVDFSPNDKYMYCFVTQGGKPVLGRIKLEL